MACRSLAGALNNSSYFKTGQVPMVVIDGSHESEPSFDTLMSIPVRVVRDEPGALREALGVRGVPHTFVMTDDRIADQAIGDNLEQFLNKIASTTARL